MLLSILTQLVGSTICALSLTRRKFFLNILYLSAFPVVDEEFKLELACQCTEKPAEKVAEKKEEEEEEEEDLFGDDDDDDDDEDAAAAMQAKLRAEAEKKKAEKEAANKKVEKSLLVIHVKPYDEETNLDELYAKIRATEVKGCKWGETFNKQPLAFGIYYIEMSCVIEDDVCSEADVIDAIMQFEDEVQSTETVSFNKIS